VIQQGAFRSLYDFCERIDSRVLNKRVFESLIKSGAMDSLGPREQLLASVDDALSALQRAARLRESGQHGLFGGGAAPATVPLELRDAPLWSEEERLASEYAMLGFYVSGHPLEKYAARLQELKAVPLEAIEQHRNRAEITVAGLIVGTRPMRSKKGQRWGIFTLQDMTGVQELLVFPESFARLETVLKAGTPLLLKARVQVEEAGTRLSLLEARPLVGLGERQPAQMRLRLDLAHLSETSLDRLQELFASNPGSCLVVFELRSPDGSVATLQVPQRVRPAQELLAAVSELCGADTIELVSGNAAA
jgi:DNA polymerase-3 subunit alpha